jgi:hypothetical protein
MAAAFEARDAQGLLSHISAREASLQALVSGAFKLITHVEGLHITDVSVDVLAAGSRARSHLRANGRFTAAGYGDIGHQPTRWELTWQKEAGDWKLIKVTRLNPISGEAIESLSGR